MFKIALLLCAIAFAGALASPASIKSDLTRLIHDVEALEGTTDAQAALQTGVGSGNKVVAVFDVGSSGTKVVFGATDNSIQNADNGEKVKIVSDDGDVKGLAAVVAKAGISGIWELGKTRKPIGSIPGPEDYVKLLFKEVAQDLKGINQAPASGDYQINMMATAGMRKVSAAANTKLWSKVCGQSLKIDDATYKTDQIGANCGTIPGVTEAYFEWYALNLAHPGTNMFSMGGASAQIAAAVPNDLFNTWKSFIETAGHTANCHALTPMEDGKCCDRKTGKKKSGEQMMSFRWCKDSESFDGSFANDYSELPSFNTVNKETKALDFVGSKASGEIPNFADRAGFASGGLILISYLGVPHKIEDPTSSGLDGARKDNFFVGGIDTFVPNIKLLSDCSSTSKTLQDCKKAIATAFCKDELYEQTASFFRSHDVFKQGKWMAITNASPGRTDKSEGQAIIDIQWPPNDKGNYFSTDGYTQAKWAAAVAKLDDGPCASSKKNPSGNWGEFDENCYKSYARLFYWGGFMAPNGLKGIGGNACNDMFVKSVSLDGVDSGSWAFADDWTIGSASIAAGGHKIYQKKLADKNAEHPKF